MTQTDDRAEPRKKPLQARSSATVESILEATARIIETQGLERLTTNRVADVAGVSIGSLYQYFPSKQALLVALIRREREALLHAIQDREPDSEALLPCITRFVQAGLDHQFKRPALSRALDYVETSLPLSREDDELAQAMCDRLAQNLARHGVEEPNTAAADLIALSRGLIDAAALRGESDAGNVFSRLMRAVSGYLGVSCR